ncbi:MAG TPA: double zinc ribbon domain-containing protein [Elusimicrobiota bacterium]|nr:double zinc ribbon domain-containing protein [Elusimicrobiota bacterium]
MGYWAEAALHVLLPRACAHCRRDLPFRSEGPLCAACGAALPPPPDPACARCAGALGSGTGLCRACAGRLFACRLTRAAASYRGPAASLVRAFKFRGLPCAAREAGRIMAADFARRPELSGFDALVPVPLHPRRERERGYNQASLLARELGAATALPVRDLLTRPRAAAPSWRLGRAERKEELAGAFAARPGGGAKGLRLLLVDDVCASATTFEECALALRRAGARDVAGYAFARAGRFFT